MRVPTFTYMRWAKRHAGAHRFDLTASAVPSPALPPVEHPARSRRLPVGDGDPACEALLARRHGLPPDHVLFLPGSTLANFVAATLLVDPGDVVLVESPVYENLPALVTLRGGTVRAVPRRPENGYRLDPADVSAGFAAGARLLLATDLHNPTGARLFPEDLAELRRAAAHWGARIVFDEVYRDLVPGPPGTAYRASDPHVLVVSSLTKAYGLGALRAGWLLAPPEIRERAARLLDYLTVLPPSPVATAAESALCHIEDLRERALAICATGREILDAWVAARSDVRLAPPAGGVTAFPGFAGLPDADPLCRWLLDRRDTAVVPGRFFGDPTRIRLAFGTDPEVLRPALEHLADALSAVRS